MQRTDATTAPLRPPCANGPSGQPRRVGVEIEFAGLTVADAAQLVHDLFGGEMEEQGAHRVRLRASRFGDFTIELDASVAHSKHDPDRDPDDTLNEIEDKARNALGHVIAGTVPTEIVCPPIAWNRLGALDEMVDALRKAGAKGTQDAPHFSFGVHLNPEVAEESADYALRHLRAYAILEAWLRAEIDIDPTRRVLPHIDPFPREYLQSLMAPDYAPDLQQLIRDHVAGNPTRNRGLDMMPLWRHLDEATLLDALDDASLVKARPTFHYRLPNASLSDERPER